MTTNIFKTLSIGGIALALSAAAANAADVPRVVVPAVTPVVAAPPPPGFDFAGPYFGIAGGAHFEPGFGGLDWATIQAQAGFNIVPRGRLLIGAEVKVGAYVLSGTGLAVDADARVGILLRDNLLVYATAGGGFYGPGFGDRHVNFGGGVEVGLGSRVSLFFEAGGEWFPGDPIYPQLEMGINFHFGR